MHAIFSVHPSAIGFSILSAPRLTVSGPISYGATVSRISQTLGGTDGLPDMMVQPLSLSSWRLIPFKTEVWSRSR
jgi:hypothetical protein